jgi:hypothetical protein
MYLQRLKEALLTTHKELNISNALCINPLSMCSIRKWHYINGILNKAANQCSVHVWFWNEVFVLKEQSFEDYAMAFQWIEIEEIEV